MRGHNKVNLIDVSWIRQKEAKEKEINPNPESGPSSADVLEAW